MGRNNQVEDGSKNSGGDKYSPSDKRITWVRDEAVEIQFGEKGIESVPSISVMSLVKSTVQRVPNNTALTFKMGEKREAWTFQQYYTQIKATAKACIKAGLEPYHGVAILGFNSKEWFLANYGAIFAGGLSVGVYTTNSADAVAYVVNSSESNICVVEDDAQLQKVLSKWEEMPSVKVVVQYSGKPSVERENVYSWDEFIKLGADVSDESLQERMDSQYVNKCCSLIYTSGTTGTPKGVMLSHDNVTYSCRIIGQFVRVRYGLESLVSYLPLSHIAGQMIDLYLPMCYGVTVHFAQPDALKGTLNTTLKEVLPTIFLGVPRVYEKMQEKLKIGMSELGPLKKKMVEWARGNATKTAENMKKGQGPAFGNAIAMKILGALRAALGLTRTRYIYSGAAPLTPETHQFFASIGLPLMEVYGMSECTGVNSMSSWVEGNRHWKPYSAGYRIPGYGYDLLDQDEKGHGEIAMRGRHVFMGYLGEEEKTKDAVDSEYRLKSGDIGYVDSDGYLFISGRIKELLITAGGENVAPVPIENEVKEALPQVSNCMLIGDKRKFLSILVTIKCEPDPETMLPTQEFTKQTIDWCKSIGSNATRLPDVLDGKDEAVTKAIQKGIDKANSKSESRAKKVQKFAILPNDFTIAGGELGPTLKLKRPVATEKYAEIIDKLYVD